MLVHMQHSTCPFSSVCVCQILSFSFSLYSRPVSSLCACKRCLKLHTFPNQRLSLALHFSKFYFLFCIAIDAGGVCSIDYCWASFIASSFTLAFVVRLECDVGQYQETAQLYYWLFSPFLLLDHVLFFSGLFLIATYL